MAWGGAGLHQETRPVSLMFDGPSLESSNKQSKKNLRYGVKPTFAEAFSSLMC